MLLGGSGEIVIPGALHKYLSKLQPFDRFNVLMVLNVLLSVYTREDYRNLVRNCITTFPGCVPATQSTLTLSESSGKLTGNSEKYRVSLQYDWANFRPFPEGMHRTNDTKNMQKERC